NQARRGAQCAGNPAPWRRSRRAVRRTRRAPWWSSGSVEFRIDGANNVSAATRRHARQLALPYLSPDQVTFRRTGTTCAGRTLRSNRSELLAKQRLACVVATLVKMADFEFDSHALPPPTSRNCYC